MRCACLIATPVATFPSPGLGGFDPCPNRENEEYQESDSATKTDSKISRLDEAISNSKVPQPQVSKQIFTGSKSTVVTKTARSLAAYIWVSKTNS